MQIVFETLSLCDLHIMTYVTCECNFQPSLFLFCSISFGHSPLTIAKRSRTSYVYNLADFSQLKLHPYNNQVNNRYVNTVSM